MLTYCVLDHSRKKVIYWGGLLGLVLTFICFTAFTLIHLVRNRHQHEKCMAKHKYQYRKIPLSPPELSAKDDSAAYLIETSEVSALDYRQACSVESLALHNPTLDVNVLMTSHHQINFNSPIMKTLSTYPNVKMIQKAAQERYFTGSPLEAFYYCSGWEKSRFHVQDLSDALRLLTLYKYGGYYFDLDIIHLRPVTSYRNFMVAQDDVLVANGVIHADCCHHPLIEKALKEFSSVYKMGHDWGDVGPNLVSRVLQSWCSVSRTSQMTSEACHGFVPGGAKCDIFPHSMAGLEIVFYSMGNQRCPDFSQ